MPIMVVAAIAIAAASTAAALIAAGVSVAIAIGVGLAVGAAMAIMSLTMQPNIPRIQSPDSASTLGSTTDPATVIPNIYGSSRTGAINVFKAVDGTSQRGNYLVQCFAIAQGEIDSISQIYMDNKKVLIDNNTHVDGIIPKDRITGAYQDILQIEISTGKNPGRHLSLAKKYIGNQWPDNFTGNGIATMCIVMHKTNKALTDGVDILQPNSQIAVELNGKKITNLVTGNREFTRNGPSCLLDFLTSTNGLNTPISQIDLDSFKVAAARTENSYWCDGGTDPNASNKANIENICSSFGGIVFDSFGKLTLKLDAPDITKYHFDEDNIVMSEISLSDGGTNGHYNTLNVSYSDPKIDYSSTVLRYPSDGSNDALIKKDKRVIAKDITMRFSKNVGAIDRLASIERNKALLTQQISFSTADAFTLEVWDVISVSNKELMMDNKLFRVTSITPMMDTGTAGTITVTAGEYNSLVYSNQDIAAKPNYDPISISTSIYQPSNLTAVSTGESVYGSNILLTWDCEVDYNRYQFYIQYKKTTDTEWLSAGNTSEYEFSILGLQQGIQYDFRVCAAGLYYQSPWTLLSNPDLTVQYLLPAPVVRLHNGIALGSKETRHQAFDLEWDDQAQLDVTVNGRKSKFVDHFDYYEIEVTQKNQVFTYRCKDINWVYTYEMNAVNGLSRNVKFAVRAIGFGGRKSNQTVLECFNAQAPALTGFTATGGFGAIFANWVHPDPLTVPDYAGVVVQVSKTASFTGNDVKTFTAPQASEIHTIHIEDGNWYVRAAAYDVFGQDSMTYTAAVMVQLQSKVNWGQQDADLIKNFLELESHLDGAIDTAFERSKDAIQVEISNLHTNITSETNQKIAASSTRLEQIVKDGDKVVVDALNQVKVTIDNDIKSEITNLNTVVASNNTAQSQALQTVKSEIQGNIAQVSTNAQTAVDALKNTINSQYTVKVNANGVVAGMTMVADSANSKSAIYFKASEFFLVTDPTNPTNPVIPFAVQNNRVFINSAIIANASIGAAHIIDASIGEAKIINGSVTNAKIGNVIQSNNWDGGLNGWAITKDGFANFNNVTVRGHVEAASGSFRGHIDALSGSFKGTITADAGVLNNVTINGNCTILGRLNANNINGLPLVKRVGLASGDWENIRSNFGGIQGQSATVTVIDTSDIPSTAGAFSMCAAGFGECRWEYQGDPPDVTYNVYKNGVLVQSGAGNISPLVEIGGYGGTIRVDAVIAFHGSVGDQSSTYIKKFYRRNTGIMYAIYG
ncbi:Fibronectin type III protein [compost metagenome]